MGIARRARSRDAFDRQAALNARAKQRQQQVKHMGKISPVAAKYIVHASIQIDGVVDRPDVIGAVFGQTEGLLGADLELRELQRSGKIGRIEVNMETRGGKTKGEIILPSSLDKAETAIIGAALEIIQRIGPCNAKVHVEHIEDVRISKRQFVIERAKELLRNLTEGILPDSQELADEVASSVRVMEIVEYGRDRLPAGPGVDESDEIIVVEGRADVLTLLKNGFKNAIAINGTSVPETVVELCKRKTVTVFVDGDRGGNLIIQELLSVTEIDYVTRAPDGKEVEELAKKEIHKCLRSRIAAEQVKLEIGVRDSGQPRENAQAREDSPPSRGPQAPTGPQGPDAAAAKFSVTRDTNANRELRKGPMPPARPGPGPQSRPAPQQPAPAPTQSPPLAARRALNSKEQDMLSDMLGDLIGTRGAYLLDDKLVILGKVPAAELLSTLKSMADRVFAVVVDGVLDKELLLVCEKANVQYAVVMDSSVQATGRTQILTSDDL
jgi:DNA primase